MPERTITRSTVNKDQYAAQEFPKSGFAPSYSRHTSAIIGRIHASGYQYVMPGDKIFGRNSGNFTFNHINTPMLVPLDCGQYTFFLPFRAVDTTFEDGLTPTELNSMSANWHTPKCNTAKIFSQLCTAIYEDDIFEDGSDLSLPVFLRFLHNYLVDHPDHALGDFYDSDDFPDSYAPSISVTLYGNNDNSGIITKAIYNLSANQDSPIMQMAKAMYIDDALLDIADNIRAKCGDANNQVFDLNTKISDFLEIFLDALLTPWIGRYSYYGEFRFDYIRPKDLHMLSHPVEYGIPKIISTPQKPVTYTALFSSTPQCEYALRIMYVIWYERFRDVHLEPVNATLPYWKRFGSTSILDTNNGGNLCYLLLRIRSWYDDPFTSAQVDDISRHVYAPVLNIESGNIGYSVNDKNRLDTQSFDKFSLTYGGVVKPAVYQLGWQDQITGENVSIECPVPSNVNDVLESVDREFNDVFGLDLNTLRQSQMLERYLKRNYLFGDEYKDRMLAHYGSRVSDMRINRPELLGQSLNQSDMKQEVSNVSTDSMLAGERTATATVQFGGDDYGTYCEEFGMVINLLTFMPRAIYDGIDAHLLLDKQTDFPLPEFATNNEEFGRKMEIASSGINPSLGSSDDDKSYMFGRYPAYHIWRGRTDEVGGMFLSELQDCTFRRFWGTYSLETTPKLNYWFLHCRPNLGMFSNTVRYDSQLYGNITHEFYVERVLPTPVENI